MLTLSGLWILWCFLHSLLICRPVTEFFRRRLGRGFLLYRLFYIGFSLLSLIPVVLYQFSLQETLLLTASPLLQIIRIGLLLYAGILFLLGAKAYDMHYFLGISQLRAFWAKRPPAEMAFQTGGILARVRHPWYSAGIALIWGIGPVTDVFVLTRTLLTGYFIIGALLEEHRLRREIGQPYRDYCRRVPMLLPGRFFEKDR